ncbi:unnamed protein product [Coccothraustes coccothraustes]
MAGGAPAADRPAELPEGPLQVRGRTEIPVAGDQRERGGTGERSGALRNKGARRALAPPPWPTESSCGEGFQRICDRRSYTCVQQQGLCLQEGVLLSECFSRITWCYSKLRCCSSTAAEQKIEVP